MSIELENVWSSNWLHFNHLTNSGVHVSQTIIHISHILLIPDLHKFICSFFIAPNTFDNNSFRSLSNYFTKLTQINTSFIKEWRCKISTWKWFYRVKDWIGSWKIRQGAKRVQIFLWSTIMIENMWIRSSLDQLLSDWRELNFKLIKIKNNI